MWARGLAPGRFFFEWIMQGDIDHVTALDIGEVSRIHFRGGSHIGILARQPHQRTRRISNNAVLALLRLNVSQLITIRRRRYRLFPPMKTGGERPAGGGSQVVHVPKTIDNDLDLPPPHVDTFGFQTARSLRRRDREEPHGGPPRPRRAGTSSSRWAAEPGIWRVGIGKSRGAPRSRSSPRSFLGRRIRLKAVVDTLGVRDHQAVVLRPAGRRRGSGRGAHAGHRSRGKLAGVDEVEARHPRQTSAIAEGEHRPRSSRRPSRKRLKEVRAERRRSRRKKHRLRGCAARTRSRWTWSTTRRPGLLRRQIRTGGRPTRP